MTKIESDLHKRMKQARHLKATGQDWEARKRDEDKILESMEDDDD